MPKRQWSPTPANVHNIQHELLDKCFDCGVIVPWIQRTTNVLGGYTTALNDVNVVYVSAADIVAIEGNTVSVTYEVSVTCPTCQNRNKFTHIAKR